MENVQINRAYLETLSFSDLQKLADDYSIDVPENFNRGFLIGEILEVAEESYKKNLEPDMNITEEEEESCDDSEMPRSYNSTEVEIILRNPAWAYIYWNISDYDRDSLEKAFVSELRIRVSSFSEKSQVKPDEFFDIQISKQDNGQYFLLPAGKKFFCVDLLFCLDGIIDILASSEVLEMPTGSSRLVDVHPGKEEGLSPIMELSGMKELLLQHYKNHRESFS